MSTSPVREDAKVALPSREFRQATGRLHMWLMLTLTFSTGVIDAVGFLGLDRVFTGNMTGNVVILGMALTGTTSLPVLGPAMALIMFFLGAVLCGRLLRGRQEGWVGSTSVALLLVTLVLFATSIVLVLVETDAFPFMTEGTAALLGLVMGIQAAAARHVKVPDVTTVVVTSTITGLAADCRWGAAKKQDGIKRFLAILLILLGALAGAALLQVAMWTPIALSAALTGTVLVIGHVRMRAERVGRTRTSKASGSFPQ